MFRLTLKNLWAYKRRLLASALSIVLGISFLAGSFVFTDTLKGLFTDLFSSSVKGVDASVRATKAIKQSQTDNGPYGDGRSSVSASIVDTILSVPEVAAAEGTIQGYGQAINKKGKLVKTSNAPTFGYLWVNDSELSPYRILNGRPPAAGSEVVLDRSVMKETGYRIGDKANVNTLEGAKEFTIVGDATFGSSDSALGAAAVFFDPKAGQELLLKDGEVQSVLVRAKPGVSQEVLVKALAKALKDTKSTNGQPVEAITGAALKKENLEFVNTVFKFINIFFNAFAIVALFVSIFVISNSFSIVVAQRTKEMAMLRTLGAKRSQILWSTILEALAVGLSASLVGVFAGMGVALGIRGLLNAAGTGLPSAGLVLKPRTVILGVGVGTFVTLLSSILPAIKASSVKPLAALRDVAVDRGAGSRVRLIVGSFLGMVSAALLVVGLGGSGGTGARNVGIAAGLALVAVTFLGPLIAKPVAGLLGRQWFGWVVVVFGGLVAIGGLAGTVFAVGSAATKDYRGSGSVLLSLALVLLGPLQVFIGVYLVRTGLSARTTAGHIARENAIRNPTRTSATALALTIGTALVSALLVFSTSLTGTFRGALDTSVRAEYVVASASDIGFPEEVKDKLDQVPGVEATSGLRFATFRFGFPARSRTVGAIDPADFAKLVDLGDVQGDFSKLSLPDTLAVDKKAAKDNKFKIGQTLRPTFPNGERPSFKIVAFYDNAEGLGNTYYLTSVDTLKTYEPSEADNFLYVKTNAKDKKAFVKAAEKAIVAYPAAELKTKKKFADQQIGQFQQFLAIVNALLLLAIIIAILGIANTLKLSIFERTREIGLLRAVGMSREQIKSAIRWEAIVVATLGSVIGVVLGTGFGTALVKVLGKDGTVKLSLPAPFLVVITLLASIVGLYAARKPAKDAATMNILRAIATE